MKFLKNYSQINSFLDSFCESFAQIGEDVILYKLLSYIKNGNYIDVGCAHPIYISISHLFYTLGWRGINIDPRSDAIEAHKQYRPEDINLCIAVSNKRDCCKFYECGELSTFDEDTAIRLGLDQFKTYNVNTVLLDDILEDIQYNKPIHFLKIDVEKHEKEVLLGINLKKYRPYVIAIECVLPCTNIPCFEEWEQILFDNNYKLVLMSGYNKYYASAEQYDNIMDNLKNNVLFQYITAYQKQQFINYLSEINEQIKSIYDNNISNFLCDKNELNNNIIEHKMKMKENLLSFYSSQLQDKLNFIHDIELEDRIINLLHLLHPHTTDIQKVSLREQPNSTVVMCDPGDGGIAYSFGNNVPSWWDLEMANKNFKVFQFYGQIEEYPFSNPNLYFIKKNISDVRKNISDNIHISDVFKSLNHLNNNDIILYININGREWDIFNEISLEEISKFKQIIIKFYLDLNNISNIDKYTKILKKISKTHNICHFHNNNNGNLYIFSNFILSNIIDLTFIRNGYNKYTKSDDIFPNYLDKTSDNSIPEIYFGNFNLIYYSYVRPPSEIPENKYDLFTINRKIPVLKWYLDNRVHSPVRIDLETYNNTFKALNNKTFQYYEDTLNYLLSAIKKFPLHNKTILIHGLAGCNCDAIAIHSGAKKVVVVDYNKPVCNHHLVEVMDIDELRNSDFKADIAISISSFEHDGLGRYGDPINPSGDLLAMQEAKNSLKPDGLLFLAVPTGADCLVWNAHRIYGPLRLPMLLEKWTFLRGFGFSASDFNMALGIHNHQPVFVLSNNPNALNIPDYATDFQKMQIIKIASHGAFDRQYYMKTYPESLAGKMDLVSHYVLKGTSEGKNPTSWFDTQKYSSEHPDLAKKGLNPFYHYLLNWHFPSNKRKELLKIKKIFKGIFH